MFAKGTFMQKQAKIILPDMLGLNPAYDIFLEWRMTAPHIFNETCLFYGVSGGTCLSGCDELAIMPTAFEDMQSLTSISEYYRKKSMPIFLNVTNKTFDICDFNSRIFQATSSRFNFTLNYLIIGSSQLAEYVNQQRTSCGIVYILSQTASTAEAQIFLSQYDKVIFPYVFSIDKKQLSTIPLEYRHKSIISLNSKCDFSCPRYEEHIQILEEAALHQKEINFDVLCEKFSIGRFHEKHDSSFCTNSTDIVNNALNLGYDTFIIEKHQNVYVTLANVIMTLLKPEYAVDAFEVLSELPQLSQKSNCQQCASTGCQSCQAQ